MLLQPGHDDLTIIVHYTGRVMLGVVLILLLPAALGFLWGEPNEAPGFATCCCTWRPICSAH